MDRWRLYWEPVSWCLVSPSSGSVCRAGVSAVPCLVTGSLGTVQAHQPRSGSSPSHATGLILSDTEITIFPPQTAIIQPHQFSPLVCCPVKNRLPAEVQPLVVSVQVHQPDSLYTNQLMGSYTDSQQTPQQAGPPPTTTTWPTRHTRQSAGRLDRCMTDLSSISPNWRSSSPTADCSL